MTNTEAPRTLTLRITGARMHEAIHATVREANAMGLDVTLATQRAGLRSWVGAVVINERPDVAAHIVRALESYSR